MPRLPQPGADSGSWGDILNDFLSQVHTASGTLKPDSVGASQLQTDAVTASALAPNSVTSQALAPNSITNAAIASDAVTAASIADGAITGAQLADGTIQEAKLDSAVQTKLNSAGTIADGSVTTPKVADAAITTPKLAASVQASLGKADSALQTAPVTQVAGKTGNVSLAKSDVGLSNVDNTSDATKNTAAATLTNKDLTSGTNTFPTFNQNTTGNAGSATKLATARTINGVSFDGTANITVADSTKAAKGANSDITSLGGLTTPLSVDQGGTGSSSQNFVDITTAQTIAGSKTYSSWATASAGLTVNQQLVRGGADVVGVSTRTGGVVLSTSSPMVNYADATSAAFTVSLPGTTTQGLTFTIKKIDSSANAVTVSGTSIDGNASVSLAKQNDFVTVVSTSTSGTWKVVGGNTAAANSGYVDTSSTQTVSGYKTFSSGASLASVTLSASLTYAAFTNTTGPVLNVGSPTLRYCDATSGAFTATLPTTTTPGLVFYFKKVDSSANAVTISGTNIDGTSSIILAKQNDFLYVASTTTSGTWKIIGGNVGVTTTDPVTAQATWTGAVTLSDTTPGTRKVQLTGNTTLTVPSGPSGQSYSIMLDIVQDATGSRTLTCSGVKWAYGVAPTLSTAANARDIITLWWSGSDWVGFVGAQAVA